MVILQTQIVFGQDDPVGNGVGHVVVVLILGRYRDRIGRRGYFLAIGAREDEFGEVDAGGSQGDVGAVVVVGLTCDEFLTAEHALQVQREVDILLAVHTVGIATGKKKDGYKGGEVKRA